MVLRRRSLEVVEFAVGDRLFVAPDRERRIVAGLEAVRRFLGQQPIHQRLQHRQRLRQARHRLGDMHDADRERILGVIGHPTDQHLVKHDAQAVEIGAPIELFAARLLRTHVVRRTDHRSGACHAGRRVVGPGDAEIGQRRGTIVAQKDVVGLDVAMDETLLLRVVDRARDLPGHAQGEGNRSRRPVLAQDRPTGQILHGDVMEVADPPDIMDADHVPVMQARGDLRFAQEALAEIRVDQQGR